MNHEFIKELATLLKKYNVTTTQELLSAFALAKESSNNTQMLNE